MIGRLKEILSQLCQKAQSELLDFGAESNHCHLLVSLSSNNKISVFVKNLKSSSSRLLRKEVAEKLSKIGTQFYGVVLTALLLPVGRHWV